MTQELEPRNIDNTTSLESMRNMPNHGETIRRVSMELNGGLSPATEAYLDEVTEIYKTASKREREIADGPMEFEPEGLYTQASLTNLQQLQRHTSRGSQLWVLKPGISADAIQAGYLRVAGRGGKEMLNWLSAASSLNLGGQNPDVETADAWAGLRFGSNNCSAYHPMGIEDEAKERLARAVPGNSDEQIVIFESTGGGANTVAMEAAVLHQAKHGRTSRRAVVAFDSAYHGNNGPAGMATGFGIREKYSAFHGKDMPTIILPYPDTPEKTMQFAEQYTQLVQQDLVAGVLVEAIQGDGGMRMMTQEAAQFLVNTNEDQDILTIWDEVQSGMGRSGKFTAVEWYGDRVAQSPNNAITMAKSLANGYPTSAAILPRHYDDFDTAGALTTMMGNPSGLVRMITAVEITSDPTFLNAVELKGEMALSMLNQAAGQYGHLRGGRGKGLMLGAEITQPGMTVTDAGSSKVTTAICYLGGCGMLTGGVGNNGLRLHPPLTTDPEVMQRGIEKVIEASELMDENTLPQGVEEMVQAGKSGLDL
ncbi:aminotransferase class III-fold pyridoxal phosphate-dependent enzyme [Candidatus Woesebacteria bacterium]|nr:MAG: aminotransferase class III-fold pyridoxal phosphate-dependent enzyme [Candidatus Woesebacteria bacterium]